MLFERHVLELVNVLIEKWLKNVKFYQRKLIYDFYGFDYRGQLFKFAQTQTSYLEHFARDKNEKGLHSTYSIDDPRSDFERDRALAPTTYLQKIREKIIEKIL